jgi:hypothetical protein
MTSDAPIKRLRLEALVAYPPTAMCREILALLKTIVAEYPDQVRLDIYFAGESPSATPTRGYQGLDKRKTVPSGYVNGRMLLSGELPTLEALRLEIDAELRHGPGAWQD